VGISFFLCQLAHKYIAFKHRATTQFRLWWSGVIAALMLCFITNGYFIWAAPGALFITGLYLYRPGYVKKEVHLGLYERGKIALAGPLIFIALAILAKVLLAVPAFAVFAKKMLFINAYLAVFSMIPFVYPHNAQPALIARGNLPQLAGVWVLYGSRLLWVFSFSFIVLCALSLWYLSLGAALLLAFVCAAALLLLFYYYFEPWSAMTKVKKPFEYK